MECVNKKVAGALLFIGAVQLIIALIVAEALYPGYSISGNYISDLGVGPSALVFNSSIFLLGSMIIAATYFIQRTFNSKLLIALLMLTGVGAMGVGLFTEDAGIIHAIFSLITFLFGGLSAIASYKLEESPFSYLSTALGIAGIVALVLFISKTYLGLGPGGMERMIAYPLLLWGVGFGGHLVACSKDAAAESKP